jgi:hypothetical protein
VRETVTYRSAKRAIGHVSVELCRPECKMRNAKCWHARKRSAGA